MYRKGTYFNIDQMCLLYANVGISVIKSMNPKLILSRLSTFSIRNKFVNHKMAKSSQLNLSLVINISPHK